jgi:hypothetical protein
MKDIDTLGGIVAKLFGLEILLQLGSAVFIAVGTPEAGIGQLVGGGLNVAVCIGFLRWFRGVGANARAWHRPRLGPGWAIGGWFTPILWFWIPCRVAVATVRGTCADDAEERRALLGFVTAWWLLWLAALVTGFRLHRDGGGRIVGLNLLPFMTMPSCLCAAAAATCAMVWVRRLTAAQTARIDPQVTAGISALA